MAKTKKELDIIARQQLYLVLKSLRSRKSHTGNCAGVKRNNIRHACGCEFYKKKSSQSFSTVITK